MRVSRWLGGRPAVSDQCSSRLGGPAGRPARRASLTGDHPYRTDADAAAPALRSAAAARDGRATASPHRQSIVRSAAALDNVQSTRKTTGRHPTSTIAQNRTSTRADRSTSYRHICCCCCRRICVSPSCYRPCGDGRSGSPFVLRPASSTC